MCNLTEKLLMESDRFQTDYKFSEPEAIIHVQVLLVKLLKSRLAKKLPVNWNDVCNALTLLHLKLLNYDSEGDFLKALKKKSSTTGSSLLEDWCACTINLRFGSLTSSYEKEHFIDCLVDQTLPEIWLEAWSQFGLPDANFPSEIPCF